MSTFSVFKRSNGIYYLLVDENGKRRWKSTGKRTKSEALKFLSKVEQSFFESTHNIRLSKFIEQFIEYAGMNFSKQTTTLYQISFKHLLALTGDVYLSSLTPRDIDLYKVHRLKKIAPITVFIELRSLKAAMNTAVRWKLLHDNPFKDSRPPFIPEKAPVYFSRSDLDALFKTTEDVWIKEIILFAVLTGMRRGEIVNLKWDAVDLERNLIHVQSTPTFKTKQGKRRTIPINSNLANILVQKKFDSTIDYVFSLNGKKIEGDWVQHKFKKCIVKAGLDKRLHFHSLRHTFASWLIQQEGVSIYAIQKLLGHSNIRITEQYSHLQSETLHRTVNKLSLSFSTDKNQPPLTPI